MATDTVTSTKTGHPRPPDSVRVWVSSTIEADFIARSAFPQLRHGNHDEMRSGFALHWCDPTTAAEVLSDATARRQVVAGPLRSAYGAFIRNSQREIEEAKSRPIWLAGSEPKPLRGYGGTTRLLCTRSQLCLMGMPGGIKLPGDKGGPAKKATFTDARGQTVSITRAEFAWPGTYVAFVRQSEEQVKAGAVANAKANQDRQKLREIERLPSSVTEFRKQVAGRFAVMMAMLVEDMTSSQGYRFSDHVVDDFKAELAHLLSLVREGHVIGHNRDELKRQHLVGRAKSDASLQSFLRQVQSVSGGQ